MIGQGPAPSRTPTRSSAVPAPPGTCYLLLPTLDSNGRALSETDSSPRRQPPRCTPAQLSWLLVAAILQYTAQHGASQRSRPPSSVMTTGRASSGCPHTHLPAAGSMDPSVCPSYSLSPLALSNVSTHQTQSTHKGRVARTRRPHLADPHGQNPPKCKPGRP